MLPDYNQLSIALWETLARDSDRSKLAHALGTQTRRLNSWAAGETAIRTSTWALLARKAGKSLPGLAAVLYAPRTPPVLPRPLSAQACRTSWIGPILRFLRGNRTLREVQQLLGLRAASTFYHWERGARDIPLSTFVQCIDQLGGRLGTFCEAFGYDGELGNFGIRAAKPNFSERFFSQPWVPTIFLAIQTLGYTGQKRHDRRRLARQLKLTEEQIEDGLKTLADLEIVKLEGNKYVARAGAFYAPPTLTAHTLKSLNEYWFGRSLDLIQQPGLHKIEEHALSRKSFEKIIGWVGELRERIRAEVETSEPETIVHIHWQVADMLPKTPVVMS